MGHSHLGKIGFLGRALAGLAFLGATAGCLTVGQAPAHAASATVTASSVGSVDMQKVLAAYSKGAAESAAFQATEENYNNILKTEQANLMLSSTDMQTLSTLLLEQNPSAADQQQIKNLEAKSQNDANALAQLQQETSPSDTDKARLTVLTSEQQNGQQELQTIYDGYKQQLSDQEQQQSQQLENDVRAAVAAVAQQKGLAVVFDSSLAIYAANDVTDLVIAKLNGTK